MSMTTPRLLRLQVECRVPSRPRNGVVELRPSSPHGGSTWIASAPISASMRAASGPAILVVTSITLTPLSGPITDSSVIFNSPVLHRNREPLPRGCPNPARMTRMPDKGAFELGCTETLPTSLVSSRMAYRRGAAATKHSCHRRKPLCAPRSLVPASRCEACERAPTYHTRWYTAKSRLSRAPDAESLG